MATDTLLVRLKARNPRAGLKAKDYSLRFNKPGSPHHKKWFDFKRAMVWHRVPVEVGNLLRTVCQSPYRPSPLLFDVCTEAEAKALDEKARIERERARAIVEPTVETAVDLTGGPGRGDMKPDDLAVAAQRQAALEATRTPPVAPKAPAASTPIVELEEPDGPQEAQESPSMDWSRAKLMSHAKELGVKTSKSMTKADLLEAMGIDPE